MRTCKERLVWVLTDQEGYSAIMSCHVLLCLCTSSFTSSRGEVSSRCRPRRVRLASCSRDPKNVAPSKASNVTLNPVISPVPLLTSALPPPPPSIDPTRCNTAMYVRQIRQIRQISQPFLVQALIPGEGLQSGGGVLHRKVTEKLNSLKELAVRQAERSDRIERASRTQVGVCVSVCVCVCLCVSVCVSASASFLKGKRLFY